MYKYKKVNKYIISKTPIFCLIIKIYPGRVIIVTDYHDASRGAAQRQTSTVLDRLLKGKLFCNSASYHTIISLLVYYV